MRREQGGAAEMPPKSEIDPYDRIGRFPARYPVGPARVSFVALMR